MPHVGRFYSGKKFELSTHLKWFISKVNNRYASQGMSVADIRADNAGEKLWTEIVAFCTLTGIKIKISSAYAPERNGSAERLVRENWLRARVLLLTSNLNADMWGEALSLANWLRIRFPCSPIDKDVSIKRWNPQFSITYTTLLEFGTSGYAYIYYPQTVNRKLLPSLEFSYFVGMESDEQMVCFYISGSNNVRKMRIADFHPVKTSRLPTI